MTSRPPLLSIIIPTYQSGAKLMKALESIASQEFKDYEVCVIDGGSTDDTAQIVSGFSSRISHIQFHCEPDEGVYDAMNKGIRVSRADWIYFLGSDDWLLDPGTLTKVAPFLNNDHDVVYGNVESPRLGGCYDGRFDPQKILNQNICHQAIFHHRSVFERLGQYKLKYAMAADWEFNLRWFLSPQVRKVHLDQIVAHYADGGLSSTHTDIAFQDDQMLLYLSHGRFLLSFSEKLRIGVRESRRAIQTWDFRRLVKTFLTLIRSCFV